MKKLKYGIESMNDGALERMYKNLTTEMVIQGVENTLSAGVSPGFNIIFYIWKYGRRCGCIEKGCRISFKVDDGTQIRTIRSVTPYLGIELYDIAIKEDKGY